MKLLSNGPGETFAYGFRLGSFLKQGDIVCLIGELGSGKTVFTKGIASALSVPERDITSASFTIIAEYPVVVHGHPLSLYHIDLYRIKDDHELDSLGLEDYLGKSGIAVIEWAEKLGALEGSITVAFTMMDSEQREIIIEGMHEEAWNNL